MPTFPDRPLNKPLDINSPADPKDVFDVKSYLHKRGFYDIPNYGLTPYPDHALFEGIKNYQESRGLSVDGVMNVNGETQNSMRIEKEILPPPIKMIPGTNIPDEGVPEQGWPKSSLSSFDDKRKYNIDRTFDVIPKNVWQDPKILSKPTNPKVPYELKDFKYRDI